MAIELEKIKSWDGQSGTGADNRGVIDRNFDKVKTELEGNKAEIVQLAGDALILSTNLIKKGLLNWKNTSAYTVSDDGTTLLVEDRQSIRSVLIWQETTIPFTTGQKFYMSARVRTLTTGCDNISLSAFYGGGSYRHVAAIVENPVVNEWYDLYGISSNTNPTFQQLFNIGFHSTFVSGTVGAKIEIQYMVALDVSGTFEKYGLADDSESIRFFTANYANNYFDGSVVLETIGNVLENVNQNKKDVAILSEDILRINSSILKPVTNVIVNGNFNNISYANWYNLGEGVPSISNNTLSVVGKGNLASLTFLYDTKIPYLKARKFFISARVAVDNSDATRLRCGYAESASGAYLAVILEINNPVANNWYQISEIVEIHRDQVNVDPNTYIEFTAFYPNAGLQSGKKTMVKDFMVIDVSKDFEENDISYSLQAIQMFISNQPNGYLDGTKSYEIISGLINDIAILKSGLTDEDTTITHAYDNGRVVSLTKMSGLSVISTTAINYNYDGTISSIIETFSDRETTTAIEYENGEVKSVVNNTIKL